MSERIHSEMKEAILEALGLRSVERGTFVHVTAKAISDSFGMPIDRICEVAKGGKSSVEQLSGQKV